MPDPSVACLCNLRTIDPTALAFQVADLYLEDELEPPSPPSAAPLTAAPDGALSAAQSATCPGMYDSTELGTTFSVTFRDGTLQLRSRRGQEWSMQPVGADDFAVDGLEAGCLTFVREGGTVVGFYLSTDRAARIAFSKQA